ncbi:MAG: prolyl oligopeptidase family serine peptidase [Pirellulaceae bacterium]|nr:prolyl oligopeptidase family serine peptidase [Pirellulaceae bacterium]
MRFAYSIVLGLVVFSLIGTASSMQAQESNSPARVTASDEDAYQWLEDVLGEKAIEWVKARNQKSQSKLEADPGFASLRDDLLAILDSNARIPMITKHGEFYYNFWRDKKNERGLWRRTTLDEYKKPEPAWEVILDLDELGKTENENWVWSSVRLLRPDYTRALIALSRGGADATVTREFDLEKKAFVSDGFTRPESKGSIDWIDRDTVFIQTDFGAGSMTPSGYPRIAKRWRRGTPMSSAETIYEGEALDMAISAVHDDSPGFERNFINRAIAFYNDELYFLPDSGKPMKIDAPNTSNKSVFRDTLAIELRDPWETAERTYASGSLLFIPFDAFLAGDRKFEVVFEPSETTALSSFGFTKNYAFINVLEDVKNKLYVLLRTETEWGKAPLLGAPNFGTVNITAVDSDESDDYFMTSTDYLNPTSLLMGAIGNAPQLLKKLPDFFDASLFSIQQHFATSNDGTRIPYFMVARKDLQLDGNNPTLLYGYGGFEISLQPNYSGGVGRAWLSQGGVYVVANIRGGGEYGPRWHQAALKANRLRAYEDFAAVARDLYARKVSRPEKLGIQGGSNGGLLVGNMFTHYPDLFKAAVCQVPLLDMKRYNKLLAGASWMAEYGNPDDPDQWEFIQTYSPYQNVKPSVHYPAVLFTTSTRDDRVHPGHARKMMARMEEQGHEVLYYENIEGGHGGAANNRQAAYMQALSFTFLKQQLIGTP